MNNQLEKKEKIKRVYKRFLDEAGKLKEEQERVILGYKKVIEKHIKQKKS